MLGKAFPRIRRSRHLDEGAKYNVSHAGERRKEKTSIHNLPRANVECIPDKTDPAHRCRRCVERDLAPCIRTLPPKRLESLLRAAYNNRPHRLRKFSQNTTADDVSSIIGILGDQVFESEIRKFQPLLSESPARRDFRTYQNTVTMG